MASQGLIEASGNGLQTTPFFPEVVNHARMLDGGLHVLARTVADAVVTMGTEMSYLQATLEFFEQDDVVPPLDALEKVEVRRGALDAGNAEMMIAFVRERKLGAGEI